MSVAESIKSAIVFAQRATENDIKVCKTTDRATCENAVTDYTRAIEMFTLASTSEDNAFTKQLLEDKVTLCRDRKAVLKDYLTSLPRLESPVGSTSGASSSSWVDMEREQHDKKDLQTVLTRLKLSRIDSDHLPSLNEVQGLDTAKEVLQEAAIPSDSCPDFFKSRRRWRTILLYGPPGVGKTFLAKAVAAESKYNFCCLTASDLMVNAAGNCEGIIRDLFAAARRSGKVLFHFDDIDFIFSVERTHETEFLTRVKSQLLRELQALQESRDDVVFIGTSQTPWLLEETFLRRMEKRIYTGLPDSKARKNILRGMLRNVCHALTLEEIENIAAECEMYSGSDLKVLVIDVEMEPLRVIGDSTHFRRIHVVENGRRVAKMCACCADDYGAMEMRYTEVRSSELAIPPVACLDFEVALDRTKPTVGMESIAKYAEFTRRKGQDGH